MHPKGKHRLKRLLDIIVTIKTEPRISPAALLRKLGVSKSQFYKDKAELGKLGFAFEYSRTRNRFEILRDMAFPVENLTISEKLALVLALRQISASGDHILTYHGLSAARKLAANLPAPLRENLFEDLVIQEGFGCDPAILDRLQQAVSDNLQISIDYQRPDQAAPSRESVHPYLIYFKRRALYLEGYCPAEADIRVYRLNRIRGIEFQSRGFAVLESYDFGGRHRNAFSAFPGEETETVTIRFDREKRPFIQESCWHHSQRITENSDGGITFSVTVAYPREVMWWAFFWGSGAEILAPEWLREEARLAVEKMGANYERD